MPLSKSLLTVGIGIGALAGLTLVLSRFRSDSGATGAEISNCTPGSYVCAEGDTACLGLSTAPTAINVYADSMYQGVEGMVTMELVDGQGMAVANRSLSFTMYRPNGQQFMNGVSFITDANGMTSFSFTPDVVGTYTVTVNFAGDAEYGASTTSVAIDVVADVGYDYKVASNVVLNATGGTAYTGTNFAEALKWATSQANKVVYVPTGTYAISGLDEACITPFASGVTLYGDGPDSTIFDFEYTGTFMSHADQNEYGWTFGLQGVNVSNVTIKQLGITGDGNVAFLTKTGTTSNNVVEDVTVFDTSHHNMGAFRVCPAVNTVANDYSFIRCTADNSGGDGFDIMGEYGSDRSTWGKVYRTYFEDCTALYCGYSSHRWNWAVGFDLRESCQHYDYTLVRCRADYNWESGFHAEFDSSSTMGTVTFTNCTANYNGQKYSQPSGACNGLGMVNGYGLYSNWGTKPNPVYDPDDDVTYYVTNFTGTGNSGGNYATGTSRYYNCDNDQVIGWTYRINPSAPNNVYVPAQSWESLPAYTAMGTTLHQTFSSATAALQYCLSQPNAVVWLRNGTVTVTGDLTFASNVCLIGDLPTWNCVPSCSYINFPSTGTTGLVLGTGARVLCIGVNYGNVKVNATTAVSGIILRDVKLYNTSSERTAAIILAATGSGSINNTSLGNVHALGEVGGCLLSGNVAEPSFTLCSGMTAVLQADYNYIVTNVSGTYYAKTPTGVTLTSGTNAATVIQAALNALTSGRTVKEKVLLQGNFTLTSALNIPSYTVLEVDGKITRGANVSFIFTSNAGYIDIIGGEWDGNMATYTAGSINGIVFSNCHDVYIGGTGPMDMLNIYGTTSHPINCAGCSYTAVQYAEIHHDGDYTHATTDSAGHWAPGIMMYACNNCLVEGNYIHDTSKGGIYVYTEDNGTKQTINNNIIRGNTVERTWNTGIEVGNRGLEDECIGNIVEGNTCIDCGFDGDHSGIMLGWTSGTLEIRDCNACIVRNNTVYETKAYYPANGGLGCGGGIFLLGYDSEVYENDIDSTYDSAIAIRGARNAVSYNSVASVGRSGASAISVVDGNNNEIVNNGVLNGTNGVSIYKSTSVGCNNNHIANNRLENVTIVVLVNESGSTGNIIELNTFVNGSIIRDYGTGTIIRNNTIL